MRYLIILRGCPGCVDDKTEFFNGTQWIPISQYSTGMKVLQYNKDGTAELVLPNGFIKYSCEYFVKLTNKTNSVNQVLTLDHNVAYLSSKGNLNKCTARELLSRYQNNVSGFTGKFINTFKFVGQTYDIDDNLLRLYIAVSADGSLTKNGFWRIRLYKDYKIKRLEFLLNTLDIPIDKRVYTDGSTNFYIPKKYGVKVFPKEFYFLNEHQRKIFKEEIFNWDGCLKTQTYRTTIKANADLVQFILSQFDYLTSISIDDRRGKMYTHSNKKYLRKSICYAVHLTNTKQTAIRKRHRTSDPAVEKIKLTNSYAYCFSVPSGLLVLRRANTIFITGNSGKSSWADAKFEPYVLSTDKIRLLLQSPITDIFGSPVISQKNNKEMGRILMEVLETRMSRGEFIVLDATHAKPNSWRKYDSLIQKYQYRVAVLEFANEPLEEYLQRNENREPYKKVPPEVIVNMYNDITNNRAKSNSRYKVYTEDNLDFWNDWSADLTPEDYSEYKSIVIFGDIHGCYTPLKSYFESHPFSDETLYIFTGDYLDRGLENYEVMKYMLSIYDKPNVICLEGNHECLHKNTEILTTDGWLNIADVVNSNKKIFPYTYNTNTKQIEVDKCLAYHKKKQEKMILIETCNTKQIVSFNHEVLINDKKVLAGSLLKTDIHDLHKKILPTAYMQQDDYNVSDDMLQLIVWIVCDGCLVDAHKNKPHLAPKLRIQFKLSKPTKIHQLEHLLSSLQIPYTKRKSTMCGDNKLQPYLLRIYGKQAKSLFNYFPNGKRFPEFFKHLSCRQSDIVIKTLAQTDGSVQNQRILWYTSDLLNADILSEMCIKNNICFNLMRKNMSGFKSVNDTYCFKITKHWDWVKNKNCVQVLDYNDFSYCITTKNGTLITRFDNKTAITGNCWLRHYSSKNSDDYNNISSAEFLEKTVPQLEDIFKEPLDKTEIRKFCRKLHQLAYFCYHDSLVVVTHAGVPCIPTKLTPTREFIKGTGSYGDIYTVEESFMKNTAPHVLQVHGHRNPKLAPIETCERNFNLCDEIEFGGDFRVLTITKDKIEPEYYPNPTYTKRNEKSDIFQKLDDSNLIKKKQCSDGIVSYNFNADAFYNKRWNTLTCTARGLFVKDKKVVARGYNKFFNIGERPETQLSTLCKTLKFPVMSYFKYNGFLGLVSVIDDEVRIFTKSQDFGEYVDYFKNVLFNELSTDKIKTVMQEYGLTNHTLIFECIDPVNDPHIVEYENSKVILLDIVENNLKNKFVDYFMLFNIACSLGVRFKVLHNICYNSTEFDSYVKCWSTEPNLDFEGFVLEDADGTRVKLKTNFYLTWKRLRGDLFKLKKNPEYTIEENQSSFEKDIFEEMKKLPKEELAKIDNVISLRRLLQDKKVNMNMLE